MIAVPTSRHDAVDQSESRSKVRLRTGLTLQLLTLIGVGLLFLGTFVVRQTRNDLVRQVDNGLEAALRGRLRDNQAPRPGTEPPQGQGRQPPAAVPTPGLPTPELPPTATVIFDSANQQVSASGSGSAGIADPLPKLDPQVLRSKIGRFATVDAEDGSLEFRVLSGKLNDGRLLVEAAPLRMVNSAIRDLIRTLTIGSLVVLGLAGLALLLLLRRALLPLGQIVTDARVVATGNTAHGVAIKTPYRELDQLSHALDGMVTKLGGALNGQREALQTQAIASEKLRAFVSDASHELQTPVTSIRGWAELYRRGGLADEEALHAAMARIENEASRMGRLVDDLLVLARADEQRTLSKQPVDLGLVCADAVEAARAIASDRTVTLTFGSHETNANPYLVDGAPDQLRQVIDNLLANIRTHTPPATKTFVHIETLESSVVITVRDNGGGFAPDQLAHAFDRFWRADQSNRKSHGIGLAIVQAIVTAHGGTVSAANTEAGADETVGNAKNAADDPANRGALITVEIPCQ